MWSFFGLWRKKYIPQITLTAIDLHLRRTHAMQSNATPTRSVTEHVSIRARQSIPCGGENLLGIATVTMDYSERRIVNTGCFHFSIYA